MSTSSMLEFDPANPEHAAMAAGLAKPRPLGSLTAAASRLTSREISGRKGHAAAGQAEGWQEDAWDMYDLVGEQRFLATTLANRLAQARFFVGKLPDDSTEDIEVLPHDHVASRAFNSLNGKGTSLNQIAARLGLNLFMPGDGWVVGIPSTLSGAAAREGEVEEVGISPLGADSDGVDIEDLQWSMMSLSEVKIDRSGEITLTGQNADPGRKYKADEIFLIRVWRPHPRHWVKADSPTRSSLPVLRELVGLTMHISAQVDSRLAGAGVLFIPQEADRALRAHMNLPEGGDEASPFAESLMEAMITPISDRSNASAVVPFMPVVPAEYIDKFRFMSFSTPLDAEARELRDEAIRRLALGQDCPPELLLGVAGMNHWGAWLVREDVVTTHLEPPLALVCDALTSQFLWTVLEQQGIPSEEFHRYVIWYDVDHLIQRPNRTQDAKDLHGVGALSDMALRDAAGFDESDAPAVRALREDPAVTAALELATAAPSLAQSPGLVALAQQIRDLYAGTADPEDSEAIGDALVEGQDGADAEAVEGEIPNQDDSAGPEDAQNPEGLQASADTLKTKPHNAHLDAIEADDDQDEDTE